MWTIVYLSQSKEMIEKLKCVLEQEGILVKVRPISKKSVENDCFELLVPESEVPEAHGIIIEQGF